MFPFEPANCGAAAVIFPANYLASFPGLYFLAHHLNPNIPLILSELFIMSVVCILASQIIPAGSLYSCWPCSRRGSHFSTSSQAIKQARNSSVVARANRINRPTLEPTVLPTVGWNTS